jgi:hypothetical protein
MLWGACGRVDPFNLELASFTADGGFTNIRESRLFGWVVALSITDSMSNATLLAVGVWPLALMV